MRKLLITAHFAPEQLERLHTAAGEGWQVELCPQEGSEDALRASLQTASVVIGEPSPALLRDLPQLQWVQMTWAGTDRYTRAAVPFPSGVRLTNASGAFGGLMSQYVLGQLLSLLQNLPGYVRQQERAVWADLGAPASLDGAAVLIFGAGDIGSAVARRLSGFDVRTVGVCRNTEKERPYFSALCTLAEAENWLPRADAVVCCIPRTADTEGYLNERRLRLMKPGAVLVNVGRGSFVDCDALARVLAEEHLRGAALDVTEPEPLPAEHPLWTTQGCVITPHISGRSDGRQEVEDAICALCCENLRRWEQGLPLRNVIY